VRAPHQNTAFVFGTRVRISASRLFSLAECEARSARAPELPRRETFSRALMRNFCTIAILANLPNAACSHKLISHIQISLKKLAANIDKLPPRAHRTYKRSRMHTHTHIYTRARTHTRRNIDPRRDPVALPILFSRTFSPSLAKLLIPGFSNYADSFVPSPLSSSSPSSLPRPRLRALFLLALCKRKYSIRTLNSITAFLINPEYLSLKEERPLVRFLLPPSSPEPRSIAKPRFLPSDEPDLFRLSPASA